MAKILHTTALALLATCFAAGAAAQTPGTPEKLVLETKAGSVMTSTSGEFQTANAGKQLMVGESIMLGDGASANVAYYYTDANGKQVRKCVERYTGPNTYVIDDRCVPGIGREFAGTNRGGAGIIIATGLIGAALLNAMDDTPAGPLSSGPNGTIRHF